MVIAAFPIAKLGALLIRQVSKPIANVIKDRAKTHPIFRTYICMPPAQFYHWCEVKTKMWVLNLGKPVNIPVLNEAMAIELGANLLGETIIFVIAAGILLAEYSRQVRKESAKEEANRVKVEKLVETLQELYFQNERQDTQIRQLIRVVGDLETYVQRTPDAPKLETVTSNDDTVGTKPDLLPKLKAILIEEEKHDRKGKNDKDKKSDPPKGSPPGASGSPSYPNAAERPSEECTCEECICAEGSHFILKTIHNVERQRRNFKHPQREPGVLTTALHYLQNSVLTRSV